MQIAVDKVVHSVKIRCYRL